MWRELHKAIGRCKSVNASAASASNAAAAAATAAAAVLL